MPVEEINSEHLPTYSSPGYLGHSVLKDLYKFGGKRYSDKECLKSTTTYLICDVSDDPYSQQSFDPFS